MPATTARSWVINSRPMPSSRTSPLSRSRICACVVTSSAVVGSSAISRCGRSGDGHGDDHALPLAARQLVRIAREGKASARQADAVERLARALHAPRRGAGAGRGCGSSRPPGRRWSGPGSARSSAPGRPCRSALPRTRAHLGLGQRAQVVAVEPDAARRDRRPVGQEPHDRERRHRLAGARFRR